jgi:hypothetical protein
LPIFQGLSAKQTSFCFGFACWGKTEKTPRCRGDHVVVANSRIDARLKLLPWQGAPTLLLWCPDRTHISRD